MLKTKIRSVIRFSLYRVWSRPEIVGVVGISLFGLLGIEWLLRGLLGR